MTRRTVRLLGSLIAAVVVAWALARGIGAETFRQRADDLTYYAGRHMLLVGYSMVLAIVVGVPAGVLLSRPRFQRQAERFMQVFNIGNTIPSLAVLAIALGIFGIGDVPAIVALFLASLLPITRNTYEGVKNVPAALREAAKGIGMTGWQSLLRVELPNALPIIVGGVRTALAINVGTAPLAYLIGADSLGSLIFPGIYLDNQPLLLLGASLTAALALALDGVVAAASRHWLARHGGAA
ncbi:ABC transporter permease [Burkholderia pseudomultivorans]|uniref:Glycine/betaine ABC transporter permease n=1 Tax=Burkholderia pseudomultivorans TaxID=1207504 RepID=A0A132ETV9_9BURK|nr:ABC transporter permease [Burkholderia pseudomultivorans]EGD00340.1 putative binding-protein-dependent transport system protein [Burkholderia sp. TJI49]AOI89376.1 glycine/betaine ABC transporter permease [Burkholderia pseudomultivorans]KVC34655.1 glycine/betaine ABC transporter permease [Burkholderia pseudomultivorans]KVC35195.1 glycine/betaine ABC transporter permease [Burkholderia pseudomultivorans]KVC40652.1 glycine/betaine ABC transporter permease [Burkholderia pseudomultivorans]